MPTLPYSIYDADNHYYEPDDCFTRHIESRWKARTVRIERSGAGPGRMFVGDERCHFFSVGAGDSVGRPGAMKAFLRGASDEGGSPSLHAINALSVPERGSTSSTTSGARPSPKSTTCRGDFGRTRRRTVTR